MHQAFNLHLPDKTREVVIEVRESNHEWGKVVNLLILQYGPGAYSPRVEQDSRTTISLFLKPGATWSLATPGSHTEDTEGELQ